MLLKSWNEFKGYNCLVIIDYMMNLEFLLWAAKASEDKRLKEISLTHTIPSNSITGPMAADTIWRPMTKTAPYWQKKRPADMRVGGTVTP